MELARDPLDSHKKNANALNQVVTKQTRNKNYGNEDGSEDFSMNSYFKMMIVQRKNECKEEKERHLDEVEQWWSREDREVRRQEQEVRRQVQQERRHVQQMAQ